MQTATARKKPTKPLSNTQVARNKEKQRLDDLRSEAEAQRQDELDSRLRYRNRDGGMLMYSLEIHRRKDVLQPSRLQVAVNSYSATIAVGKKVIVPWFVVTSLADRIEQFPKLVEEGGERRIEIEETLADTFDAHPIDPVDYNDIPWPRESAQDGE